MRETLCPLLEEEPQLSLTSALQRLAQILEIVRVEEQIPPPRRGGRGREQIDRRPLARAFLAKAVLNLSDTRQLLEQLRQSPSLRGLCGMEQVPSEATFSRAFAAFAKRNLGEKVHRVLVKKFVSDQVVMHVSHDSTAVEAREKATKKEKQAPMTAIPGVTGEKKAWSASEGRNSSRKTTKTAHSFGTPSDDDGRGSRVGAFDGL